LRELSLFLPGGLALAPFGWWDYGRARCGFNRDGDWPLTKLGPIDLLFDDQCTSQPRAETHFTISGHDSFPSPFTRQMETWGDDYQSVYFVHQRSTAGCMATTITASHELGSPRGFRRLPGVG
jgi:hypothetical protein